MSLMLRAFLKQRARKMKTITLLAALSLALLTAFTPRVPAQVADGKLDRTMLPIAEPDYPRSTVLDARDTTPPPRFEVKAPEGAPNVVIVLIDDMGFGMPSAFGGPVRMPAADRLASQGLRYNQFHTTALCSPTRSGFDKFYGFIGGETDQWSPSLYEGLSRVETPHYPGYNFMTDMTNNAIAWTKFQKALTPDKPFFMYFAPGATHAPHHVPKEWIAKNKGRFDGGFI